MLSVTDHAYADFRAATNCCCFHVHAAQLPAYSPERYVYASTRADARDAHAYRQPMLH